jgi:radical SAM protein with 4Fe4S-binding SPASM domain
MDRPACAGLWETPMVHVTGDVTTCCLDEHLANRLGNVRETPLAELWNGPTVHAWRLAHAEGRFEDSGPHCARCNWRSAGAYAPADVEAWLARTGETRALARLRERRRA